MKQFPINYTLKIVFIWKALFQQQGADFLQISIKLKRDDLKSNRTF